MFQPVPVSNMLWSRQQRAFAVEAYFSNSQSVIAVQRTFRRSFNVPPLDYVPDRKYVLMWMEAGLQSNGECF
ncbi:DUF4817 domain-containing protein [Trichonephila clavipes]|nr:DUF4817 domain-containing protein [Trichonephila clavipes]